MTDKSEKSAEEKRKESIAWFGWLNPSRTLATQLLTDVHRILDDNLSKEDSASPVGGLFAGAAFSLWRAVFLLDSNRKHDADYITDAEQLLARTIATQSVTFETEYNRREWFCGFYISNARHRLEHLLAVVDGERWSPVRMSKSLDLLRMAIAPEQREALRKRLEATETTELSMQEDWAEIHSIARALLDPYMSLINLPMACQ